MAEAVMRGSPAARPAVDAARALAPLAHQDTVLLTTYRRDGTPVGTPVSIVVDGDRAVARSYASAGKIKRIRRNPEVTVAPSTFRGRPTGPAIRARARLLEGDEAAAARRALARRYPILHGVVVPLFHRLTGKTTVYLELRPVVDDESLAPPASER